MKKSALLLFIVFLFLVAAPSQSYAYDAWGKLGRGLGNAVFGWVEVLNQPQLMVKAGQRWPVALGGGVPKGIFFGLARTLVGLYEVLTFPAPIPDDFKPIIEPEFVISPS